MISLTLYHSTQQCCHVPCTAWGVTPQRHCCAVRCALQCIGRSALNNYFHFLFIILLVKCFLCVYNNYPLISYFFVWFCAWRAVNKHFKIPHSPRQVCLRCVGEQAGYRLITMDLEGDNRRHSPIWIILGLNSPFDGRNNDKTRENLNGSVCC